MGRRGGGVLLYIKESIPAYEVQLQEEADCKEALWCNLVTGHTTVTIGVVYRCPNITIQNNEKIHKAISDRWQEEKHYDLRWRLYHPENRYKTEQGGGRSRVFTGSKNRACDRESREDRGKRKWRDHTSTRRDEQHGQGRNNGDS